MNRLIIAALPLLALALSAGAGVSLGADGFARAAETGGALELAQHEDTYGDDNYFGDQEQTEESTDEYGDALPEDQPAEDEYADDEAAEDEYADDEEYEDVEVDADDGDIYNKDPQSLVQPGDTFDPYAPQ